MLIIEDHYTVFCHIYFFVNVIAMFTVDIKFSCLLYKNRNVQADSRDTCSHTHACTHCGDDVILQYKYWSVFALSKLVSVVVVSSCNAHGFFQRCEYSNTKERRKGKMRKLVWFYSRNSHQRKQTSWAENDMKVPRKRQTQNENWRRWIKEEWKDSEYSRVWYDVCGLVIILYTNSTKVYFIVLWCWILRDSQSRLTAARMISCIITQKFLYFKLTLIICLDK